MFLSGNLGNTNLSLALFDGETLLARAAARASDDPSPALARILGGRPLEACGYCSVNPTREEGFESAVRASAGVRPLRLGRDVPVGLEVRCREPGRVGVDRLAAARGALVLERSAAVVVDAGTAITVNAVTGEGAFLGGAIVPGYRLAARALAEGTALLPFVEPGEAEGALGRDTEEAIRGGLFFGIPGLVDALVEELSRALPAGSRVLATGGDAPLLARRSRRLGRVVPELVHLGVRAACARR
ncbi:MAG TPA: type III pantothenate kinase [Planctomycetota bacterium]|nr:type III pantothenate kinase [Planctomycetota bacterium]